MMSYIRLLFFCGVLMLMSGCVGGTTKPSSFFSLSATEANQTENIIRRDGPAVRLGMFAFPDYLPGRVLLHAAQTMSLFLMSSIVGPAHLKTIFIARLAQTWAHCWIAGISVFTLQIQY